MKNTDECHELVWRGKKEALTPPALSRGFSIEYIPEASINPDTTKNIYIEGDNLEALCALKSEYAGTVGMVYIDPPYNTGKNFIYKDSFSETDAKKTTDLHSGWLNMMYPRLSLARHMLRDNGVIFISIDSNELANLKLICDEIFGEKNFVEIFIWAKTNTPPSLSSKIRKTVEYILCYEKKASSHKFFGQPLLNCDAPLLNTANPINTIIFPPGSVNFYNDYDRFKKGAYKNSELLNDIIVEQGHNVTDMILKGRFKWSQEKVLEEITNGTYFLIKSDKFSIRYQRPASPSLFKPPTSFLGAEQGVGTNESAVKELTALGLGGVFDYPKPVSLIRKLIRMSCYDSKDSIIMDFFSGSASTAHAVMLENFFENSNHSFIMIQNAEPCTSHNKAFSSGFQNISQIGVERIRRSIKEIKTNENMDYCLDLGFRFYRVTPAPGLNSPE